MLIQGGLKYSYDATHGRPVVEHYAAGVNGVDETVRKLRVTLVSIVTAVDWRRKTEW